MPDRGGQVHANFISQWSNEELMQKASLLGIQNNSKPGQFRKLSQTIMLGEDPQKPPWGRRELASLMKDAQSEGMVTRQQASTSSRSPR